MSRKPKTYDELISKFSFTSGVPDEDGNIRGTERLKVMSYCINCGQGFHEMENTFTVKSERNTGTNFMILFLNHNTELRYIEPMWKHAISDAEIKYLGSINSKIFVCSRDIFGWIISFFRNPWHVNNGLGKTLKEFITTPIESVVNMEVLSRIYHQPMNTVFERHENIVDLYNKKYRRFINVADYHIRYENVLTEPYDVLYDVSKILRIRVKDKEHMVRIDNTQFDQHRRKFFEEKKYMEEFSEDLYQFIVDHLDKELYKTMGYDLNG